MKITVTFEVPNVLLEDINPELYTILVDTEEKHNLFIKVIEESCKQLELNIKTLKEIR